MKDIRKRIFDYRKSPSSELLFYVFRKLCFFLIRAVLLPYTVKEPSEHIIVLILPEFFQVVFMVIALHYVFVLSYFIIVKFLHSV